MELLGTYSINRINTSTYEVVFEIPDNANYNLRTSPGSYSVEIQLDGGQTQPSANYNTFSFTALPDKEEILIEFVQQDDATIASAIRSKPIIRIYI
jgi:hypothetical protein